MFNSFATQWTTACQAPLSMEFPRQEYWTGLPFSSPGELPELVSCTGKHIFFLTTEPPGKTYNKNLFLHAVNGKPNNSETWKKILHMLDNFKLYKT